MKHFKEKIKDGINIHLITNTKFKTDFSVVFLSVPLLKENVTSNALIPAVLKDGTEKYESFKKITEELEMLYGASFDCGIDKTGDNLVLKFYIESINENFLPEENNNLEKAIDILFNIVFKPKVNNSELLKKYVDLEKNNLEMIINAQRDDKDLYSYERCINIMYNDSGYGLSKYGKIEDLKSINEASLYKEYLHLISSAKIDIIISGDFENEHILNYIKNNNLIKELEAREEPIIINHFKKEIKQSIDKPLEKRESMDITQGKLVIGLDILPNSFEDFRFTAILYNAILGNGVNSKLFQIVREKESLAYTTKSEYVTQKNNMFIRCGIDCNNYQKTCELIRKLIEQMRDGDFTDEDLRKAKDFIIAGIDAIDEEQDSQILYIFGQELSKIPLKLDERWTIYSE